jgi:hypothetical protein
MDVEGQRGEGIFIFTFQGLDKSPTAITTYTHAVFPGKVENVSIARVARRSQLFRLFFEVTLTKQEIEFRLDRFEPGRLLDGREFYIIHESKAISWYPVA